MMISFECIFLDPLGGVLSVEEAEAKPGAACLWFKEAAAAIGRLREDRRTEGRVRRNAEANSLIVSLYWREFDVEIYISVRGFCCRCESALFPRGRAEVEADRL